MAGVDVMPQPWDGPDYHAERAAWIRRHPEVKVNHEGACCNGCLADKYWRPSSEGYCCCGSV